MLGEVMVRHTLTPEILYQGVVQSENIKVTLSEL